MKNIYLMCLPRSGSTYFYKLMRQSPDIVHSYREPFNIKDPDLYHKYIQTIDNIKSHSAGVLVKDTLTHVRMFDSNDYKQLFLNFYQHVNEQFYVVKLYRRNIFEQAVSNCIAEITDTWSTPADKFNFNLVTIPVEHLKFVLDSHKIYRDFLKNFQSFDKIIYYEDLIDLHNLNAEWVFDFLTPPAEIKTNDTIQNPPKHKIVINYNEIFDWYEKNKMHYEIDYDN